MLSAARRPLSRYLFVLCVCSPFAGCPPHPVAQPTFTPYSDAHRSLDVPEGWKTAQEPDGSLRLDAPTGDVVVHVGSLPEAVAGVPPDTATVRGLEVLGVEAPEAVPVADASQAVACAKGLRLGNVVVLCLRSDAPAGTAVPTVIFQGTPAAWERMGLPWLSRMTASLRVAPGS